MDISEIDKNLAVAGALPEDLEWFDIRLSPFKIYGLIDCGADGFRRLPDALSSAIGPNLHELSRRTAGGRVRFKTDSPYISVRAHFNRVERSSHMAFINWAGFDVYKNSENKSRFVGSVIPPWNFASSYAATVWTGGAFSDFTVNFPSYGSPVQVFIGLKKGCRLEATDGYCDRKPIVFYGSSITQGGCASRPGLIYENYISRRYNIDYVNLGFSGNGLAEEPVVDYMTTLPMSIFVSDYDHNAPDAEYLKNTHYRMYEHIRTAYPDIPYIMLTKPDAENDSSSHIRRDIIHESYLLARRSGDNNVHYIDGKRLFGGENRDNCTVDGCHPNDLGMYRFADALIGELDMILNRT